MRQRRKSDKFFLGIVVVLVFTGFLMFSSASLGLLVKENINFSSIAFKQLFFGIFLGGIAMLVAANIHYRVWKKYSFFIFVFSLLFSLLVFVPGLGFEHGGARRWISIGPLSMQPAELLKFGFVVYIAALLSSVRSKIGRFKYGVAPGAVVFTLASAVLAAQPDSGTLLVLWSTALLMFLAAGGKWKHAGILILISAILAVGYVEFKPYVKERLLTYLNPDRDQLGAGWQIKQSLIAIGSGGLWGRGFGQSIQKFNFLPEPIGDSIFSVIAEEFGFVGATFLIALFLAFLMRGVYIARHAPDMFGGLLVLGIVILIVSQSFINIASMLNVIPLTGLPLLFISKGGTALMTTLFSVGVVLNVSKYMRKRKLHDLR